MASFRLRGKNWYFTFIDADGRKVERRGCSDKQATRHMAARAEAEAAKVRAGLIDPKADAFRRHDARPLADHLGDWHADLLARGNTAKHARLSRSRVARLIELARLARLSDLAPSKVQAALGAIREGGASLRSIHHHVRCVKGFSRWLWRDGRAREDVLAHLTSPNPDADRRRRRRALAPEELARLFAAAEAGPVVFKLPGPDRAALYRVAAGTGFRASELASLAPASFDLDADPPTVTVAAAYSKRRRDDVQPIRPDLAAALRPWLAAKDPGRPLFPVSSYHTAEMIRADLGRAGIPYETTAGVADFHALRHSFITALARSNAPVKVVQSLARHSTPTLTLGIYAHVELGDQAGALASLPPIGDRLAEYLPNAGGAERPERTHIDETDPSGSAPGLGPVADREPVASSGDGAGCRGPAETDSAEGVGFEPTDVLRRQRFSRPLDDPHNSGSANALLSDGGQFAEHLPNVGHLPPADPELAEVADAWPDLPEPIRAGILAMVRASLRG